MSHPEHLPLLSSRLQFSHLQNFRMSRTERQVNAFHYVVNLHPIPSTIAEVDIEYCARYRF